MNNRQLCTNNNSCQATHSHSTQCPSRPSADTNDKKTDSPDSLETETSFYAASVAAANFAPELAYSACMTLQDLDIPETLSFVTEMTLGWNYWDGVCSILAGIDLVNKGETTQGVANIVNGVQLIATSWTFGLYALSGGSIVLAPISFAVAMVVDLYNATKELYTAAQEVKLETWFAAKVEAVNKLHTKIAATNDDKRRTQLEKEKTNILIEMGCRYRVAKQHTRIEQRLDNQISRLSDKNAAILNTTAACTDEDIAADKLIQAATEKRYRAAKVNLCIKALSLAGMTLFSVASIIALFGIAASPAGLAAVGVAATAICSAVAVAYLTRFSYKLFNQGQEKQDANQLKQCKVSAYSIFKARQLEPPPQQDNADSVQQIVMQCSQ